MEAHSDHEFFSNEDAVFDGISDFKYFLNGVWKFSYAKNYDSAIKNFYEMDYDCHSWDEIRAKKLYRRWVTVKNKDGDCDRNIRY